MKMRKILFGVMVALVLIAALTPIALAQDSNRLAQLKISVWPEYDTPTVLVLLDGMLADKTNLPREVFVLIPSTAKLTVTTWQNADGSLAPEQPYKTAEAGNGYTRVTFTTSQPQYRVEYYDDLLKGAPDKTMNFVFKSAAAIDTVNLEIQQPLKATNFTLTPPASGTRTDPADGFKYFTYQFANVTAEQLISTQAKYTKTDSNPSIQPIPTALPSTTSSTAAPSSNDSLMLLVGLVALGLVAVLGLFLYQQRARQAERVSDARMSPREFQRQRRRARGAGDSAPVFCVQCGNILRPEDSFCPKCGAKRRVV